MSWKGLLKFVLLTAWIVFVSLFAHSLYKPDVYKEGDVVYACLREIKKAGVEGFKEDSVGLIVEMQETYANVMFVTLDADNTINCFVHLKDVEVGFLTQGMKTLYEKRF